LRKLVALALAILFLYKALEEHSVDPLWSLIYVLVSLDYLLDGRG